MSALATDATTATDATEADHEASTAENEKRYHDALQAVVSKCSVDTRLALGQVNFCQN